MATDTFDKLVTRARATPNRGRVHIFLGDPRSDGCDKTTVEPGNVYSPGVWTCGVSLWALVDGEWRSVETLPDGEIDWSFITAPGDPPVVESRYTLGPLQICHRLCHRGSEGSVGCDYNQVSVAVPGDVDALLALVVRDVGPAGGQIAALDWSPDTATLAINGEAALHVEQPVDACTIAPADAQFDSPVAVLAWKLAPDSDGCCALSFSTRHGFAQHSFAPGDSAPPAPVADGFAAVAGDWSAALPARVFAPDPRIALTWERCAYHIQAAMECCLPRIGAVNYPVFWVRDGVIVLRALDLMGRSDLARIGNDYLAPLCFAGGFGAEADAPGEGIWSLATHGLFTRDSGWLARVFPHIAARVEWLERMVSTTQTLRALSENRMPRYVNTPGVNVICLPAQYGLIHGRMDWHTPDFYINCWALCGFTRAAEIAGHLGHADEAEVWQRHAYRIEGALAARLLPDYGNPRDAAVAPYPTGALAAHADELQEQFERWFRSQRLDAEGQRVPEPLWTYFEAAQIHNAILLGLRDEAWICLDGMLADEDPWDVSAYIEGLPVDNEYLPFRNAVGRRGWLAADARGGNMPHNWTSGELINLIRDIFVREQGSSLVLGCGVPRAWLAPGSRFGVTNLPTAFGPVSYEVRVADNGRIDISYTGPEFYTTDFPAA